MRESSRQLLPPLAFPIDIASLSRPDICERYLPLVRERPETRVVFDTVDLSHVRLQQAEQLTHAKTSWQEIAQLEFRLARAADRTIVTTDEEQHVLAAQGIDAFVIPVIESPMNRAAQLPWQNRSTLLFLGNYAHAPNVDAAAWLRSEIMPILWDVVPTLRLVLAGADPTTEIRRLKASNVDVPGYVSSLEPTFAQARVFVAPIRFGAGMKGKIVESLAHGLPLVTTSVGSMGLGLHDGVDALIADDPAPFAEAVLRLYRDRALWETLSSNALTTAQRFSPEDVLPLVRAAIAF